MEYAASSYLICSVNYFFCNLGDLTLDLTLDPTLDPA